jgi:hypothetical protein
MMSKSKRLTIGIALLICMMTWMVMPAAAAKLTLRVDYDYSVYNPTPTSGSSTGGGGGIFVKGTPTTQNGDPDELTGGNLSVWAPTSPSSEDSSLLKILWRRLVSLIRGSTYRIAEAR